MWLLNFIYFLSYLNRTNANKFNFVWNFKYIRMYICVHFERIIYLQFKNKLKNLQQFKWLDCKCIRFCLLTHILSPFISSPSGSFLTIITIIGSFIGRWIYCAFIKDYWMFELELEFHFKHFKLDLFKFATCC